MPPSGDAVRGECVECDPLGWAGSFWPRPRAKEPRRWPQVARIAAEAVFILGAVAEQPDMTLAELKGKLCEQGMSVGIATLWRFFQRHRITLKK
jgi:transposase